MMVYKIEYYAYPPNISVFFSFRIKVGSGSDFFFCWAGSGDFFITWLNGSKKYDEVNNQMFRPRFSIIFIKNCLIIWFELKIWYFCLYLVTWSRSNLFEKFGSEWTLKHWPPQLCNPWHELGTGFIPKNSVELLPECAGYVPHLRTLLDFV